MPRLRYKHNVNVGKRCFSALIYIVGIQTAIFFVFYTLHQANKQVYLDYYFPDDYHYKAPPTKREEDKEVKEQSTCEETKLNQQSNSKYNVDLQHDPKKYLLLKSLFSTLDNTKICKLFALRPQQKHNIWFDSHGGGKYGKIYCVVYNDGGYSHQWIDSILSHVFGVRYRHLDIHPSHCPNVQKKDKLILWVRNPFDAISTHLIHNNELNVRNEANKWKDIIGFVLNDYLNNFGHENILMLQMEDLTPETHNDETILLSLLEQYFKIGNFLFDKDELKIEENKFGWTTKIICALESNKKLLNSPLASDAQMDAFGCVIWNIVQNYASLYQYFPSSLNLQDAAMQRLQHQIATPLLTPADIGTKVELTFVDSIHCRNSYFPPRQPMDSSFIEKHIANEMSIDIEDNLHSVELSPSDFNDLSIDFHPGFAAKGAFLGKFKSSKKRVTKSKYSDQTPMIYYEHKRSHRKDKDNERIASFEKSIRALSNIPMGSRLRYINLTDCKDMKYTEIMTLLASEIVESQMNIVLRFEDIKHIQQKVKTSSGALMAWHVKQQTLGVNFSTNMNCCCTQITHSCVRDIVDSWYITLVVLILIVYDLCILFYTESHLLFANLTTASKTHLRYEENMVLYLTLFALVPYFIEIVSRIYGYGKHFMQIPIHKLTQMNPEMNSYDSYDPSIIFENAWYRKKTYCYCLCCKHICGYCARGWIECMDSLLVLVSLLWTILDIIYFNNMNVQIPFNIELSWPFLYECLRIIRVLFRVMHKIKYMPKCIRLIVRVNRQTYFDETFDLDLCYIVYPRYLVMSWPSSGFESLYRNPLKNVAQFLNKYHHGNYLIFDLCKERSYDDILFNGRVMRSRSMTDHSVCSLSDMFEFAVLVHLWLKHNPIHCAVIHCKGGKGRTGLMVCACLMYDYRETTVEEALEYFATMRTNITKPGKLQGVETPSQLRYCKYFYQLLHITDALKLKQQNKCSMEERDVSQSYSTNTKDFYKMVMSATPPYDIDSGQVESDDDDQRIMDNDTKIKIAKHLGSDDLNISGLKQNKHGRSSIISTHSVQSPEPPETERRYKISTTVGSESEVMQRYKTSDVHLSSLKVDQNKLYVRGQWQTRNPMIGTQLLLRQRFTPKIESPNLLQHVHEHEAISERVKTVTGARQKKSTTFLERQRDSTVMAQSLAQSIPQSFAPLFSPSSMSFKVDNEYEDFHTIEENTNITVHKAEEKNIDMSDDFVSINNESYLCELFLKQPVVMKLKYVSIGPMIPDEWNKIGIRWKIQICVKPDFDYLDDIKVYNFTQYTIHDQSYHKLKFSTFHNLDDGQTSLALNGNICFKILRCKKEGMAHDKRIREEFGDCTENMIGCIWIHSHFIPANYKKNIDIMTFRKEEIDNMYKDKKHKTSIPESFCVEIGYRSSRIRSDSVDHRHHYKKNRGKYKTALI